MLNWTELVKTKTVIWKYALFQFDVHEVQFDSLIYGML